MNKKTLLDLILSEIKEAQKKQKKDDDRDEWFWWNGYERALNFILANIMNGKSINTKNWKIRPYDRS